MPNQGDQPRPEFLERKLATILSADVAEFSRLMAQNEEETLRVFRSHKQVFESLVAMHRGRIFNTAGDAILAEFSSAVEAVRCATDIQAALRTANHALPPERQVRFRIGINLGDVMVHGQDLLGDGVNVAARLQTAAEPGGICISGTVHDQIINKLSLSFHALGEMSFKNIQRPIRTFSIIEMEDGVALPGRKSAGSAGRKLAWGVAAGLVALAAGAYWIYVSGRSKAERAQVVPVVSQPIVANSPQAVSEPAAQSAKPPEPSKAKPLETPAAVGKVSTAKTPHKVDEAKAEAPGQLAGNSASARKEDASEADTNSGAAVDPAQFNGVYSGPICYAETKKEPQRCYHAEGRIRDAIISGEWALGPAKKVRAMLAGRVTRSGGVKIEIETHNAEDDSRLATITLAGTLKGGLINAAGSFRNGRPATLSWHKNPEKAH